MRKAHRKGHWNKCIAALFLVIFSADLIALGQGPGGRTIYRDADGNLISDREFVDIRVANYHYPDATVINTYEDGTIEFRLQRIPQEGTKTPKFEGITLSGRRIGAAEIEGKVVVLNFWFIGCGICRAEIPMLNRIAGKFAGRDDIVFIAVTADPMREVRKFLADVPFDYEHLADGRGILDGFRFSGYPKTIVISKEGGIVYWRSTIRAWEKFESVIEIELSK
jgi:thiol-disulfide isomerase/thioredoxin